jgi:hypothetical protein
VRGIRVRRPGVRWERSGFRNRVSVVASWSWNYLRRDRPIRVIGATRRNPVAEDLTSGGPARREPHLTPPRTHVSTELQA